MDIVYRNGSPTPDTSTQKEARTLPAPGPVWLGRAGMRDTWHRKYATVPSPVFPRSFMILQRLSSKAAEGIREAIPALVAVKRRQHCRWMAYIVKTSSV